MLPATGAWIFALDWLLFSSNILSVWLATPVVMVVGFVLGSAGTYLLQRRAANDAPWSAVLKAVAAGIVIGIPWPIGGTLVGGWVLLSSGLGDVRKEIMGK
jgi:ABC-type Mn2+/Zn2+ transport system permease subunit